MSHDISDDTRLAALLVLHQQLFNAESKIYDQIDIAVRPLAARWQAFHPDSIEHSGQCKFDDDWELVLGAEFDNTFRYWHDCGPAGCTSFSSINVPLDYVNDPDGWEADWAREQAALEATAAELVEDLEAARAAASQGSFGTDKVI